MKKITDFRNFLYIVWKHLGLPDPTAVQYDIAKYIEQGHRRCMVQAFRQVGKTYILAAYVLFCLYINPDLKIGIISKSEKFAIEVTRHCYKILCSLPHLSHLIPEKDDRQSASSFDVKGCTSSPTPSVYGLGITGQLTGKRADILIVDDIETSANSATALQREQLERLASEFTYISKRGGRVIYLGTPHSEESLYNTLIGKGYDVKIWPFEVPDDKSYYEGKITEWVQEQFNTSDAGTMLEPERWPETERLHRLAEGMSKYRLQNMLNTDLSDLDKFPLKLRDLIVMDIDPEVAPEKLVWSSDQTLEFNDLELPTVGLTGDRYHRPWKQVGDWLKYQGSVMAIDPSGRGLDETGYAVIKYLNGYLYCTAAGGMRGGYEEQTLERLATIAKDNKVNKIVIEKNFGDGMWMKIFEPILHKIYPCTIEEVSHHHRKELRIIDTLEPVMNQHKLVVDASVIREDVSTAKKYDTQDTLSYQLFYQMTRLTKDRNSIKHDDRLDALSIAVNYWTEKMAVDADRQIKKRRQDELREFYLKYPDIGDIKKKTSINKRYNKTRKVCDKPTLF